MAALPGADAEAPAAVPATVEGQAAAARQLRESQVASLRQRVKDLKQQQKAVRAQLKREAKSHARAVKKMKTLSSDVIRSVLRERGDLP